MKLIQGILRHGALSTTERYVKRLSEDLRGTVELLSSDASKINSHPKEKGSA
ncbi:hypothetical protein DSTSK_38780 [Desulforhabdus sp. TSK]|nr:hypothetical protein DSTSK_38780 [Desulforhabdus sp. TSK]